MWSVMQRNPAVTKTWMLWDLGALMDDNGKWFLPTDTDVPFRSRIYQVEYDCRYLPLHVRMRWNGYFSGNMGKGTLLIGGAVNPEDVLYDWTEQPPDSPQARLRPRVCAN
jgi:hypothetical protein